ncbi:MAG: hypothetical protein KJ002_09930 [Candidatus Dadabacteria bacterium]|jgi:hypothetical protein|nr:hypothetical protein [Candidatus Dadabacteria bacterium]
MEEETLDTYIRKMEDQELKGLLLKLKNELRRPEAAWEPVRQILTAIRRKNSAVFTEISDLVLK